MRLAMFLGAMFVLAGLYFPANAASGATAKNSTLRFCVPSIFDETQHETKARSSQLLVDCLKRLVAMESSLTADQRFTIHMEQARRSFVAGDFDQMARHVKILNSVAFSPFQHEMAEVMDVFFRHFDEPRESVLASARQLSEKAPDNYWAHKLYYSLAASADHFEDTTIANKRMLRLRPRAEKFYDLGFVLGFYGHYQEAVQMIENALELVDTDRTHVTYLMSLAGFEAQAGNFGRATKALDLLDGERSDAERKSIRRALFQDRKVLRSKEFFVAQSYGDLNSLKIERATLLSEQGNTAAAIELLGDTMLSCRDPRCLKMRVAIAEYKGQSEKAKKLLWRLENTQVALTRKDENWERDFLEMLPGNRVEFYELGTSGKKPKFKWKEQADGWFLTAKFEQPLNVYELRKASLDFAKQKVKKAGYDSFMLLASVTEYTFETNRKTGDKKFMNFTVKMEIRPVDAEERERESWRAISALAR